MKPLYLHYNDIRVGVFTVDEALHMDLTYDEGWLKHAEAFPLSQALPLQKAPHRHPHPAIFLENLLPEEKIRRGIEQAHKLPHDNAYLFLKEFGQDLAGAFKISELEFPEKEESRLTAVSLDLIRKAIAEGRQLYQSITDAYGLKFSLAGAQDKFCILYQDDQIFVSQGCDPSTHIAKVNLDFSNSQTVYNEYFCMKLAEKVGLNVPEVSLVADPALLIVKRYDRTIGNQSIQRLHQEDFCQAQSVSGGLKYESRGGPSLVQNYQLIRKKSAQPIPDLEAYLNWIAFNLVIGNNDTHSKNISFLYQSNKVRLAPFYDLLSTSVYGSRFDQQFAIKIGGIASYDKIRSKHIQTMETSIGVRPGKFLKNLSQISHDIEKNVDNVSADLLQKAPGSTIAGRIQEQIEQRLRHLRTHGGLKI